MGHQNFFATRLYTDVGTSDTTITLETPPTETSGRLVLEARNPTQREIITYANVSGNDITGVTRGVGGTSAKTHVKNALVEMNLTAEDISDLYDAFDALAASFSDGWVPELTMPNTITALGNRSYSMVFNATDLTDTISKGMKLRMTRTVTAPTRCTDLEASSSQYFSKSSPTAMTFTDDFVVSAWIKLESYADMTIASRYNGTSGWKFNIGASGQVQLVGYNASSANYSLVQSHASIPLGRWVHVTAQLDMSAFTNTTTTSYVMIDGLDVPASVARAGTNPTALVQAGDLQIGRNNTSEYFDGKIAQVAIYNAKVTQATLLARIDRTLSGSETSLISAYSFNNAITDLSANANNLTANGGALATATDSPFAGGDVSEYTDGTTEMGIVTNAVFSTNTTLTVQVPEGYAIPTTGGINALAYSVHGKPYGFPNSRGKWRVMTLIKANNVQSSPTAATWYNMSGITSVTGGQRIIPPIGEWKYGYESSGYAGRAGNADGLGIMATLSTANNSETDTDLTSRVYLAVASAVSGSINGLLARSKHLSQTAATTYYLNYRVGTAGAASDIQTNVSGIAGDTVIYADLDYL